MRKTQLNKTQKTAVVGGTVLAIAVGGVAFAAWTSNGTGTGTVTAGQAERLDVSDPEAGKALYPSESQTLDFVVTNPNSYNVDLQSFEPTVTVQDHEVRPPVRTNVLLATRRQATSMTSESSKRIDQGAGARSERTTAVRDDLVIWRERCAWADLASWT